MMLRPILAVLAYAVATFGTQAVSHFVVNAQHYASVAHLRAEPILPLGVGSMLVQGTILAFLYSRLPNRHDSIWNALKFAWLVGGFLVSYIAFAEAAKYTVPAVGEWIAVELGAGAAQFTLYGVLLGSIHRFGGADADRRHSPRALRD